MGRPNPLTDELPDDTKAELAAMFAEMRQRFDRIQRPMRATTKPWRRQPWEGRRGW